MVDVTGFFCSVSALVLYVLRRSVSARWGAAGTSFPSSRAAMRSTEDST